MRARKGTVARSFFAAAPLLLGRRLLRDRGALATSILLAAFVFFLAAATPQFIDRTADDAARQAIASAGDASDLTVRVPVSPPLPSQLTKAVDPADVEAVADGLRSLLPAPLAEVYLGTTTTVRSPAVDVDPAPGGPAYRVRFGLLTSQAAAALTATSGALPVTGAEAGSPVDAVISAAGASVTGLGLGEQFAVTGNPPPRTSVGLQPATPTVAVRIAAIAEPNGDPGPSATLWADEPTLFDPTPSSGADVPAEVTVLLSPAAMSELGRNTPVTFEALLRLRFDPALFSAPAVPAVNEATGILKANNSALVDGSGYPFVINSGFSDIASAYSGQLRAASAQMDLVLAGLLGVGIGAQLLVSALIARGRRAEFELERARGSSFSALGVRAVVEGALVTAVSALLGLSAAAIALSAPLGLSAPVAAVAMTGVVVVPLQAIRVAGGLRRRTPVARDRSARRALARLATVRRLVLEAAVLVAAAAAVLTVRARGVSGGVAGDSGSPAADGTDPLVALAPLLVAVTLSLIVLRLAPLVVTPVARLARRSTGALGVVGAAGAARALRENALLPLAVLTVGIALATSGAFFAASVSTGQDTASVQVVGADVRVDGAVTRADLDRVAGSPGVERAARVAVDTGSGLDLGTSTITTTVLGIDTGYPDLVASAPLPESAPTDQRPAPESLDLLRRLSTDPVAGDALPAVVDERIASRLVSNEVIVSLGQQNVRLRVIGTVPAAGALFALGPAAASRIYVDLDRLTERLGLALPTGVLLIDGPGAEAAAASLAVPGSSTLARTDWLDQQRSLPLVQGVQTLFAASALAFAVLALTSLVATALAGSRARVRETSLLHTMGFRAEVGWWLALCELLPTVVGAIVGGLTAGAAVTLLVGPALDLASLAGGRSSPALQLPTTVALVLAGAAVGMLALAVLAEVAARRRGGMIDVLRVGETV